MRTTAILTMLALASLPLHVLAAEALDADPEVAVATTHAPDAQVYECKADAAGRLVWQFREAIATLLAGGETVGRHYAGPNREMADGSAVTATVAERSPGASPGDIPRLRLVVASRRGAGQIDGVTTIYRLNTRGGVAEGGCDLAGAFLSGLRLLPPPWMNGQRRMATWRRSTSPPGTVARRPALPA
jgi:hypothetical protein